MEDMHAHNNHNVQEICAKYKLEILRSKWGPLLKAVENDQAEILQD